MQKCIDHERLPQRVFGSRPACADVLHEVARKNALVVKGSRRVCLAVVQRKLHDEACSAGGHALRFVCVLHLAGKDAAFATPSAPHGKRAPQLFKGVQFDKGRHTWQVREGDRVLGKPCGFSPMQTLLGDSMPGAHQHHPLCSCNETTIAGEGVGSTL
eukprot:1147088-Pelagomonas_calceolata.AAC.2